MIQLADATDLWGHRQVSSHAGVGLGQLGDVANHDVINGLSSQIILQSDDSLQIGASGGVESIQRVKAS
jgi:hypothetical protein